MTLLLLTISGIFLKGRPVPPGLSVTLNQCITACYVNKECAGTFYNRDTDRCYQDTFLYSFPHYFEEYIQTSTGFDYYEWESDVCKDDGWKYHRQSDTCFKFVDENASQNEASAGCQVMNSSLLSLNTEEKNTYFKQLAVDTDRHIWTSGRRFGSDWVWGNGQPVGNHVDLKTDSPVPMDCILINESGNGWDSTDCDNERRRYVCERNVDSKSERC